MREVSMATKLTEALLGTVSPLLPESACNWFARRRSLDLIRELEGKATDALLELMFEGMKLMFTLSPAYRENIKNFTGRYVFRTLKDGVASSAWFARGRMEVLDRAIEDWEVRVSFKDAAALRAFLFSPNPDVLKALLEADVETDGNVNYIYRFAFMTRDLQRRLGAAA
jgi:hypothetical protein